MKRYLCIMLSVLLLFSLSSCVEKKEYYTEEDVVFTQLENGNLLSPWGTEYALLAYEWDISCFGDPVFQGGVLGEETRSSHMGLRLQTGLFSVTAQEDPNILIRREPHNEWESIYRKASLPPFDYSVDNCIRLEFVFEEGYLEMDKVHVSCGDGITDKTVIAQFLSDIRLQQSPREAGLYEMIKKPDGTLENCHSYAVVYGFFAEEPNVAVRMDIMTFNDLAYSIEIEGKEYVLPGEWMERLQAAC